MKANGKIIKPNNKISQSIPTVAKQMIHKTDQVLMEVKGVFPFTFFPDRVIIDENKVTIVRQLFFFSNRVFPVNFSDLKNAVVTTNLLFGALEFELGGYEQNPDPVTFLPKKAAIKAQQLITGLLLAHKQKLDLSHLPKKAVVNTSVDIGHA